MAVPANDTASQMSPLAASKAYKRAWNDGTVDGTIAKREDIGKSLTGGGLTLDAVNAIQEYLAYCRAVENDKDKPDSLWREYQEEINQHIAEHVYSAIQCYRRGGKTYDVGLWFTAAILAGMSGVIGLPTMLQGKRQLMRDVQINVARLAVLFPDLQRRNARSFNTTEIDYPFGGRLIVLSADKGAEKEGYGCDLLGMDESHKAHKTTLGIFQPFTDDAVAAGHGKVILIGVGEEKDSAMELVKYGKSATETTEAKKYAVLTIDDKRAMREHPHLIPKFENAKATMTANGPGSYAQMYGMRPVRIGSGVMFKSPILPKAEYCPGVPERRKYAGWDPGKRQDDSMVCVIETGPSTLPQKQAYNIVDSLQLPPGMEYPEQCREIRKWLTTRHPSITPGKFAVEDNGVGDSAADTLRDMWSVDVNSFFTSDWSNRYYAEEVEIAAMQRRFGCEDEEYREELNRLTFTLTDKGSIEYEHSDKWAACRAAMYAEAFG